MKAWLAVPWSFALQGWLGKQGRQTLPFTEVHVIGSAPNTGQRFRYSVPKHRKKNVYYTESFQMLPHESQKMLAKGFCEA